MEMPLKRSVKEMSRKEKSAEAIFLVFVFCFLFIWAMKAPLNASPDEGMRYEISHYIVKHGNLPDGRDPEIRNPNWGISYAFNPYTSCILAAGIAKVTTFFTDNFEIYYKSMRLVNVIFGTLLAFLALRIGKRLFEKEKAWLFTILVTFLPGAAFLHTYLNMDSVALLSTAWIIYCWIYAVQEGWDRKICIQLGLAMSLCVLSYYNAYGFLLCSALLFAGMMLKCGEKQWNYQEMLKKGFLMLGIVFLLTGWWFVHNAILYDGDILGMATSSKYAEMYAIEELKPSNRETPKALGMAFWQMLIYMPGTWEYNWMGTVAASFIGTFGFMNIFMPEIWTKAYIAFLGIGALGNIIGFDKKFHFTTQLLCVEKTKDDQGELIVKRYRKLKTWNEMNFMRFFMVVAIIIPTILLCYYSYASDFQAQGRYVMPALIPLMYFVTLGYESVLDKCIKNKTLKKTCYWLASVAWTVSCILVYLLVYAPNY